jgi:hypothetical protein
MVKVFKTPRLCQGRSLVDGSHSPKIRWGKLLLLVSRGDAGQSLHRTLISSWECHCAIYKTGATVWSQKPMAQMLCGQAAGID